LVESYRVTPSIDLKENSNFYIFNNSLVDVDVEELNVILSSSGQAQIVNCSGTYDNSIEKEEEDDSD